MDLNAMLSKLQSMQSEMDRVKRNLANKEVVAESGGGMVSVRMSGDMKLISVDIAPDLMASGDKKMIEDLIVAAVNQGYHNASLLYNDEIKKMSEMLPNIPGLNLNL